MRHTVIHRHTSHGIATIMCTLILGLWHVYLHPARAATIPTPSAVLDSFDAAPAPTAQHISYTSDTEREQKEIAASPDTRFTLETLSLEGVTAFTEAELSVFFQEYIGTQITPKTLFDIAQKITKFYREKGYLLSRAYVPEQSIHHGNATIAVAEGFVDKIVYRWVDMPPDDRIRFYATKLKKKRPLNNDDLERALLLIKDLPGISVSATIRPSVTTRYASELILVIKRQTVNIVLDSSDDNAKSIGKWRQYGSLSLNSFLGMNEQITIFGAMPSAPLNRMLLYGGDISVPIDEAGTKLHLKGDMLRTKPDISIPNLKSQGRATTMSLGIRTPLIRTRALSWHLSAWLDYKKSEEKLWNAGHLVENRQERLRVGRLETTLDFADHFGGLTLITAAYSHGIKGLGARLIGDTRKKATPSFSKVTATLSRVQQIAGGFSLAGLVRGQYGGSPLVSLERFNYGGAPYNHIYPSGFASGDSGVEAKLEVRYTATFHGFLKYAQLFGYYDRGMLWNRHVHPGEKKRLSLGGTAVGARLGLDMGLSLFAEYGMPSRKTVNGITTKKQLYVGVTFNQQAFNDSQQQAH